MSTNKSKIKGYDSPLGWPAWVSPVGWPAWSSTQDITKVTYTRSDKEKEEVTLLDSETDGTMDWTNTDWDVTSAKGRSILAMRYQIDAYWEALSQLVVKFAETYGADSSGTGDLDIDSQSEYEQALCEILKIQGYIKVIDQIYQNIFSAAEQSSAVYTILEESERNRLNDYQDPETGQTVSGNMNPNSTQDSYQLFESYVKWANNISSKLNSISKYDEASGEVKAFYDYEGDYPRSVSLGDRTQNLQQFKEDVYMLDKLMAQRAIRSVWVFLQIGNMKFSTWDQSNYITDFDYKKNGSGCANSFTFNLTYVPAPGDPDINRLEKVITKRKVFFQYGYNEQYNLCSPQYQGEILQYSVSTENNTIKYSLVGYSEIVEARFLEIESWPGYGARKETDDGSEGELGFGIQATVYAERLFNTYLSAYGYEIINEAVNDDQETVITETEGNVFECATKILAQAKLTDELQKKLSDKESEEDDLTELTDVDISNSESEVTSYFTYVIDDKKNENNKKTITITRVRKLKELEDSDITPSVVFAYGGASSADQVELSDLGANLTSEDEEQQKLLDDYYNSELSKRYVKGTYQMLSNMVLNFSTSYDGAVTMSRAYVESSEQLRIDENGDLIKTYVIGNQKSTTGATSIQDEKYSYWLWEKNTMYSYDATLTMLGVPSDIPIGTYIYVMPIINGYEHHTGGYYYITGTEDKVTQQGYTTTLKLLRVVDSDVDEILAAINNLKKIAVTNYESVQLGNKTVTFEQEADGSITVKTTEQ